MTPLPNSLLSAPAQLPTRDCTDPLFDSNPCAILIVEETTTRILNANFAASKLFGMNERQLCELFYAQLLSPVMVEVEHDQRYLRADGLEFRASVSRIPMEWRGQTACALIIQDQTSATDTRDSLSATLRRLQRAQEITQCGSWDWNIPENTILLSRQALSILGLPLDEALERPVAFDDFLHQVHREDRSYLLKTIGEALTAGQPFSVDYRVLRSDGEVRHLRTVCQLDTADAGIVIGFFGTIQDVTRAHLAARSLDRYRNRLQELTIHLQSVREEERKRIARELHDQLGQLLTVLRMGISWVEDQLPAEMPAARRLRELKQISDTTVDAVRRIIADLRPPELSDLGLVAALNQMVTEFSRSSATTFHLRANQPDQPLPELISTTLFRLIQEGCTNILRHAGAQKARVDLIFHPDCVIVQITDDGIGLPEPLCSISDDANDNMRSFGLLGMRERVKQLHGVILFERPETGGTLIDIVIPLTKEESQND